MAWALQQVAEHNSPSSCWVIINNHVYDVTDFLPHHPGGRNVILQYAGCDATAAYEPIHPKNALQKHLPLEKHLGKLSNDSIRLVDKKKARRSKTKDEQRVAMAQLQKPPIHRMLSLYDLEQVARLVLSHKALAYYSSAADDEITYLENQTAFSRFFFHPRVLRAVSHCDPSTFILGYRSSIPVFACGAALAKLGHPLGEANITRGCYSTGIIQMVSTNASLSWAEISEARPSPKQPLFFQLYKHRNDLEAEEVVREVVRLGYKAIFLTVDAITPGNREQDLRVPFDFEDMEKVSLGKKGNIETPKSSGTSHQEEEAIKSVEIGGTAGLLLANDDLDMTWEKTIPWLRSITNLPLVLKGIQCVEDIILAAEAGVDGILLSNHGGRQLEYALPPIEVLHRLRMQQPLVFNKLEIYIDGGARRGTDVLKALCLGAKAVGMGRPFLYAQSAYGEDGVVKAVQILEREIITGMRLLGVTNVSQLVPEMVERVNWQSVAKL